MPSPHLHLEDRLWAVSAVTLAVLYLAGPSTVPLDLWAVDGAAATALASGWLLALLTLVARPGMVSAHYVAAFFGVAVLLGRGGGFLELVVHDGRHDLVTAVAERGVMAVWSATWHLRAVKMINRARVLELYRAHLDAFGAVGGAR